jgi:hypothetical protein
MLMLYIRLLNYALNYSFKKNNPLFFCYLFVNWNYQINLSIYEKCKAYPGP